MNWIPETFSAYPYPIEAKSHIWAEHPEFGDKPGKEFSKLWFQVFEKGKQPEKDVRRCIQQWPTIAGFQFLLAECLAYRSEAEADRVLQSMVDDQSDSYFSLLAQLWRVAIADAEAPSFMNGDSIPQLNALFPDRTTFHAFEVYAFEMLLAAAMLCKSSIGTREARKIDSALMIQGKLHFKLQDQIIDKVPELKGRKRPKDAYIPPSKMASAPERIDHLPEMAQIKAFQTETPPVFQLEATEELYYIPPKYDHVLMTELLAADRKALIADLETILDDAATRFFELRQDPEVHSPVVNTLVLLCHLRASESIPAIVRFLSRPDIIIEWWLGATKIEYLKFWLALFLKDDIHAFDSLILNPEVNVFVRDAAVYGLEEVALLWPERIPDMEPHLLWLLRQVNEDAPDIDDQCTLNNAIAGVASTLHLDSLHPTIETLIEEDLLDSSAIDWHVMYQGQFVDKHGIRRDRLHEGNLRGMYGQIKFRG